MRTQDYAPPRLTLGVVGVIAIIIPILLGYFLVSGMATNTCYEGLCGTTSTTTSTSSGPTASVAVSIPNGAGTGPSAAPGYAPDTIKVVMGTNNTVVWSNDDSAHHTVTSVSGNGSISSGDMAAGATFNYTFTSPGTYKYICDYHSWMSGTVVVVAGTGAPALTQISIPSGAGSGPSAAPGYSPDVVTVVMGVNNTVVWTNNDSAHHTVTSLSGNGSINSGDMAAGATFNYIFTSPGTYKYICDYHSWMTGTVIVVAGSSSNSSSTSTSTSSSTSTSTSSSTSSSGSGGIQISMPNGAGQPSGAPGYSPDTITLVIGVNATVTWTNNDSAHHTVTSVSGNGSISSGDMAPGATYSFTFTTPGTYQYFCVYHSWMTGTIIVKAGSAPPPAGLMISIPNGAGLPSGAPGYSPDKITLVIGVNNTVTWINNDTAHHTVTSVSGNGSISSGDMAPAATYSYTFTTPGTYQYHCMYHSWMTGTITVIKGP